MSHREASCEAFGWQGSRSSLEVSLERRCPGAKRRPPSKRALVRWDAGPRPRVWLDGMISVSGNVSSASDITDRGVVPRCSV